VAVNGSFRFIAIGHVHREVRFAIETGSTRLCLPVGSAASCHEEGRR